MIAVIIYNYSKYRNPVKAPVFTILSIFNQK